MTTPLTNAERLALTTKYPPTPGTVDLDFIHSPQIAGSKKPIGAYRRMMWSMIRKKGWVSRYITGPIFYLFIASLFLGDFFVGALPDYPAALWMVIISWAALKTWMIFVAVEAPRKAMQKIVPMDNEGALQPHRFNYLVRVGLWLRSPIGFILLFIGWFQVYVVQTPIGFYELSGASVFVLVLALSTTSAPTRIFHVDPPAPSFGARVMRGAAGGHNQKSSMKNALDKMDD